MRRVLFVGLIDGVTKLLLRAAAAAAAGSVEALVRTWSFVEKFDRVIAVFNIAVEGNHSYIGLGH